MNTTRIALTFLTGLLLAAPLAAAPGGGHGGGHGNAHGGNGQATAAAHTTRATDPASHPIGPKLAASLQAQLPPGTSLTGAQAGFRTSGLFVAAVRVSRQLGIPFDTLKSHITAGATLGQSIHALRPTADANGIARRELDRAVNDLAGG